MLLANFLIERLANAGIKHVFGVPGDHILEFYKMLWDSENIEVINTTDESNAGFAADAYARVKGTGCVVVTYRTGASKIINAVQCAYAERSPLIVISGAPGLKEKQDESFIPQRNLFSLITCATAILDDATTAGYQLDKAFVELHRHKQPIYIELPRDMLKKSLSYDVYKQGTPKPSDTDKQNLEESLSEVSGWLGVAKRPVILAGVEIARCDLGEGLVKFAERSHVPIATTLLSKSVINEDHPLFAGVYTGSSSCKDLKELLEGSDCLMMLGAVISDILPQKRDIVHASIDNLQIRNHTYKDVYFTDFCKSLFKMGAGKTYDIQVWPRQVKTPFEPKDEPVSVARLFERVDAMITKDMVVVADIGDSLYGAADITIAERHHFISPAFYSSMGFAIPGALAVQMAAPHLRPVVLVGDSAAQMSMSELSTIAEKKLNPIVFILNNRGYATYRRVLEGNFNNIRSWAYYQFPDLIGYGKGYNVTTEVDLEAAITASIESKQLSVIMVNLRPGDVSSRYGRMTSF